MHIHLPKGLAEKIGGFIQQAFSAVLIGQDQVGSSSALCSGIAVLHRALTP